MGLEAVELLIAFEDAFDIAIPDDAAERIATVRDAIDYIYAHVPHSDSKVCLTHRAFNRLRSTLRAELGVQRADVRPTTQWEALIPRVRRRETWRRLGSVIGPSKWPHLQRSTATVWMIALLSLASAAAAYLAAPAYREIGAIGAAAASGWLAVRATLRWQIHFAHEQRTVGQLAEMLAPNMPAAWRPSEGWTHAQVREVVRSIIVSHLNIPPTFSDDASFVENLGVD